MTYTTVTTTTRTETLIPPLPTICWSIMQMIFFLSQTCSLLLITFNFLSLSLSLHSRPSKPNLFLRSPHDRPSVFHLSLFLGAKRGLINLSMCNGYNGKASGDRDGEKAKARFHQRRSENHYFYHSIILSHNLHQRLSAERGRCLIVFHGTHNPP